jgi:TfoX/Sxy family transcriptional regulator of competence genes
MATSQATMEYITDQLARLGDRIRTRKMFGEYALYCDGKVVALICDNQLFLKPTEVGKTLLSQPVEQSPFPGAKPMWLVTDEFLEDREWLCQMVNAASEVLPFPKAKNKKAKI